MAVFNGGYGRVIEVNSPLITSLSPNMARMRTAGILLFLRVFFLGKYLTSNLQLDHFDTTERQMRFEELFCCIDDRSSSLLSPSE